MCPAAQGTALRLNLTYTLLPEYLKLAGNYRSARHAARAPPRRPGSAAAAAAASLLQSATAAVPGWGVRGWCCVLVSRRGDLARLRSAALAALVLPPPPTCARRRRGVRRAHTILGRRAAFPFADPQHTHGRQVACRAERDEGHPDWPGF